MWLGKFRMHETLKTLHSVSVRNKSEGEPVFKRDCKRHIKCMMILFRFRSKQIHCVKTL